MKDPLMTPQQEKAIISKDAFLQLNDQAAHEMSLDQGLQNKALEVLIEADRH